MHNKGWIKLHRKINENIFLSKDNNGCLVFVKLLTIVSSKGEWAGGRRQLAEKLNFNDRTLYDILIRLESQQLINIKSNHRYSIITICKWHNYQSPPNHSSNHSPTTAQPQPNTLIRIENKNKESDKPAKLGAGYRKAKKTAQSIKQKSGKIKP